MTFGQTGIADNTEPDWRWVTVKIKILWESKNIWCGINQLLKEIKLHIYPAVWIGSCHPAALWHIDEGARDEYLPKRYRNVPAKVCVCESIDLNSTTFVYFCVSFSPVFERLCLPESLPGPFTAPFVPTCLKHLCRFTAKHTHQISGYATTHRYDQHRAACGGSKKSCEGMNFLQFRFVSLSVQHKSSVIYLPLRTFSQSPF